MEIEEREGVLGARFDRLVLGTTKRGAAVFACPVCANRVTHDGTGIGPVCTGPHPSLDEHDHTEMVLVDKIAIVR
jgi:hypothetical protein